MEDGRLTAAERGRLWLRLGVRLGLALVAVALCATVVPRLISLFMPFLLALLLVWLLNPAIRRLEKYIPLSRRWITLCAILLLLALVGGALGALGYALVSEISSLLENWQEIWGDLVEQLGELNGALDQLLSRIPGGMAEGMEGLVDSLFETLQTSVPRLLTNLAGAAGGYAMGLPSMAVGLVIFFLAAYFIAADYPRLRQEAVKHLSPEAGAFWGSVRRAAIGALGGYVRAQLILSCAVFVILLIGFLVIRQPYAVLLAILLGVLDFIPIVGSGTIMVPWAVIDLFLGEYTHGIELMVIWGIIALFRQVAEPKIVGDQTGLSPILSLLSIYVGMRLGGVLGMILGPVVCMVGANIVRLGVFRSTGEDLRAAVRDVSALLKGKSEKS